MNPVLGNSRKVVRRNCRLRNIRGYVISDLHQQFMQVNAPIFEQLQPESNRV